MFSGYPQNSSSIDEAEAVQSTEIPGPSRQLSIPGPSSSLPSTSNAVDSVMEHQQLASMQVFSYIFLCTPVPSQDPSAGIRTKNAKRPWTS